MAAIEVWTLTIIDDDDSVSRVHCYGEEKAEKIQQIFAENGMMVKRSRGF